MKKNLGPIVSLIALAGLMAAFFLIAPWTEREEVTRKQAWHKTTEEYERGRIGVKEARATATPPMLQWEAIYGTINTSAFGVGGFATSTITSPVFDTTKVDDLEIVVDNTTLGGGSATSTLLIDWIANSSSTEKLYERSISIPNNARAAINISRFASNVTAGTGETVIPHMPGANMQFTLGYLSSAGTSTREMAVYGR